MKTTKTIRQIEALPPEAQKLVAEFVALLSKQYGLTRSFRRAKHTRLTDEPFIGMWKDRKEMRDSTAYNRKLRQREWQ